MLFAYRFNFKKDKIRDRWFTLGKKIRFTGLFCTAVKPVMVAGNKEHYANHKSLLMQNESAGKLLTPVVKIKTWA